MLTGEIRSQIDAIWNTFWTGGISNPLEVFGGYKDHEFDTVSCGHCNQIILVKPGTALTTCLIPRPIALCSQTPR